MNKTLGSLLSLTLVGGFVAVFVYLAFVRGGLRLTAGIAVGDVVRVKFGTILIEPVRITHADGSFFKGVVTHNGRHVSFTSGQILQNSLTIH